MALNEWQSDTNQKAAICNHMKRKKYTKLELLKKLSDLGVRNATEDAKGPTAFELPGSPSLRGKLTPEQEEQLEVDSYEEDVRRHRVMKGHPPEGPIFEMRSEEEIEQRIAQSKERLEQLAKRLQELLGEKKDGTS